MLDDISKLGGAVKQLITPQYSSIMMSKLLKLQSAEKLCDVFISNDDIFVPAHSFILAAVSPFIMRYISSRVKSCFKCSHQKKLIIPVTSITKMINDSNYNCMDCVFEVISYIYSGCIAIKESHFDHIVNITCNLEIEELLSICYEYNMSKTACLPSKTVSNSLLENSFALNLSKSHQLKATENLTLEENYAKVSEDDKIAYETESNELDLLEENSHFDKVQEDSISKNNNFDSSAENSNLHCNKQMVSDGRMIAYKFVCSFCGYGSNSCRRYIKHLLREKHSNKCSICSKEFENNKDLIEHILSDYNFPFFYTCHECSLNFKSRHSFKSHLFTHNDSSVSVESKMTFANKTIMGSHVSQRPNNSEKTCEFCSYKTKYSSYLKRHLLKHYRKLLTCSFKNCNFSTVWKNNLKSHLKTHRVSEKEFKCRSCPMQFSLKKNLQRHINLTHNDCQVFNCFKCNYSNKRLDKLKAHYRSVHSYNPNELAIISEHEENSDWDLHVEDKSVCPHPTVKSNGRKADSICKNAYGNLSYSEKVVYLNESTGELTFFCDSDGKPLRGVPDIITVHSIGGMKDKYDFDASNSAGLFLNEITGELSCSRSNFHLTSENGTKEKNPCTSPEATVTVLDEATGEITSKPEQISIENDINIMDFDNIFDTIDFDAMNDDSFDGFDDFDNALFEAEFTIGPSSPDMVKILNEFTGELFTDQSVCQYPLDKQLQPDIWKNKNPLPSESDKHIESHVEELAQMFLDEVTGELIGDFSSILK